MIAQCRSQAVWYKQELDHRWILLYVAFSTLVNIIYGWVHSAHTPRYIGSEVSDDYNWKENWSQISASKIYYAYAQATQDSGIYSMNSLLNIVLVLVLRFHRASDASANDAETQTSEHSSSWIQSIRDLLPWRSSQDWRQHSRWIQM